MIRLRGKYAGEKLIPRQFCNDWISATTPVGKVVIVNPTTVELEPSDVEFFMTVGPSGAGTFWHQFTLDTEAMRFRKIGRSRRSAHI